MTPEMLNVARCVMRYTEIKRRWRGRGRPAQYTSDVDAIAGAARQLAEMVLNEDAKQKKESEEKP